MKKLILAALFFLSFQAYSQNEKSREEAHAEIENLKIAMITKHLELSSDEAEKFWPVYNAFSKERDNLRRKMRKLHKEDDNQSDAEIKKNILLSLDLHDEEAATERKYTIKMLEILSPGKVQKLHRAEMKFKRMLLEKLGRRGGGPRGGEED